MKKSHYRMLLNSLQNGESGFVPLLWDTHPTRDELQAADKGRDELSEAGEKIREAVKADYAAAL
jgi:hypothetical protein